MITNIEISGRTYGLRFDHNAMADLEERAGMGIKALFDKQMEFSVARVMLWAGLKWKNPGLTLQVAGNLVQAFLFNKDGSPARSLDDLMLILVTAMKEQGVIREVKDDSGSATPGADDPLTPTTETPEPTPA